MMVGSTPIGATNYMLSFFFQHYYIFALLLGLGIIVGGAVMIAIAEVTREIFQLRNQEKLMAKEKEAARWKMKDGREILLMDMSDSHLTNTIKMIARQQASIVHKIPYPTLSLQNFLHSNPHYQKLTKEAKRRKMIITILDIPIVSDERKEYVDIYTPIPPSKIKAGFLPTEWDSRS